MLQHTEVAQCLQHSIGSGRNSVRSTKQQPLPPLRYHPVQYAQMQMHVCVQRRAKAVHKQHPAAAACRRRTCARSRCRALHFAHRDPRHPLQAVWSGRNDDQGPKKKDRQRM